MAIRGLMRLNGQVKQNAVTDWGLQSLLRAMFEDVPFPADIYMAVVGYARGMTTYEGTPDPYTSSPTPETLGYLIANTKASWSFEYNPDGSVYLPSIPPTIDGEIRSYFEFSQSSGSRAKLSPFNITGTSVASNTITFGCPQASNIGEYLGDTFQIALVDTPTLYDNNARIFASLTYLNFNDSNNPPWNFNLGDGATFSYTFDLT